MNIKKREKYKRLIMGLISSVLIIFLLGSYACAWLTHYNLVLNSDRIQADHFGWKGNLLIFGVYLVLIFLFSRIYNGFRIGLLRVSDIIYSQCLSVLFINGITYVQICLLERSVADVLPMLWVTLADMAFIGIWAFCGNRIYSKLYAPKKMVIIYGSRQAVGLIEKMSLREDRFMICRAVSCDEDISLITELIVSYDAVIICDVPSERKNDILKICFANSKRTYITPKLSDIIIRGAEQIHLFDTPLLVCRNSGLSAESLIIKRAFDILLSALGCIVTSPIMLITALCIKLYDGGPVFYTQDRLTRDGKVFKVYKFRSMKTDAEKDGVARLAGEHDDRITPVGRVIRKVRIDELPQLLNILKGDMSIVGPRPERKYYIDKIMKQDARYSLIYQMQPGLTSEATLYNGYTDTMEKMLRRLDMDISYLERRSLWLDTKIIIKTALSIVTGRKF